MCSSAWTSLRRYQIGPHECSSNILQTNFYVQRRFVSHCCYRGRCRCTCGRHEVELLVRRQCSVGVRRAVTCSGVGELQGPLQVMSKMSFQTHTEISLWNI